MTEKNYLSVCSGIEAASVAFEPLGWRPLGFAEIEVFPSRVLAHHYGATRPRHMPAPEEAPDAKERRERSLAIKAVERYPGWGNRVVNFGDFTKIGRDPLLAGVDVLCGGTPCQAFSFAGLRQSLQDSRGNLTLEFVRLADAVDDVRSERGRPPCAIVWENVPGVLSTDDNAFGCFLGALVDGKNGPVRAWLLDPNEPQRGASSTLNISDWPNDASVCSLSQVLLRGLIHLRYFLSRKACVGILRRAEERKKSLPELLLRALHAQTEGATSPERSEL